MLKVTSLLAYLLVGTLPSQAAETSTADKLAAQIHACMRAPEDHADQSLRVTIEFKVNAGGEIIGMPVSLAEPKSRAMKALIGVAKYAIMKCAPYPIVPNETVRVNFVP